MLATVVSNDENALTTVKNARNPNSDGQLENKKREKTKRDILEVSGLGVLDIFRVLDEGFLMHL
jgi:hypothetical protein